MIRAFLANPRFAEHARLLFRLHGLIATDTDESAAAEDLRAQMDLAWVPLSAAEREELRKLSEQLYALYEGASVANA
jgi:hypothetical protein